jgi:signal recognition particle receptor subunit alpha
VDLYGDQLKKPHTSVVECPFDPYFDQQIRELENATDPAVSQPRSSIDDHTPPSSSDAGADEAPPPIPGLLRGTPTPAALNDRETSTNDRPVAPPKIPSNTTSTDVTPIATPDTSRPSTPSSTLITGASSIKGLSRRAKKSAAAALSANVSSGDEVSRRKPKAGAKSGQKKLRRWDADGLADEDDGAVLDYSAATPGGDDGPQLAAVDDIRAESVGTRTGKGQFVLKDLDDEVHSILQGAGAKKPQDVAAAGVVGSSLSAIGSLFRNVVGGKVLTQADLQKPMKGMEEHLLNKNVAREAAVRLCEGVERELVGVKTGSFESLYFPTLVFWQSAGR